MITQPTGMSESGSGARSTMMQEWVTDIRYQCLKAKVPFFFKQWGGVQKKRAGRKHLQLIISYGPASRAQRKPIPPLESVGKFPVLLVVRTRSAYVVAHEPPRQTRYSPEAGPNGFSAGGLL